MASSDPVYFHLPGIAAEDWEPSYAALAAACGAEALPPDRRIRKFVFIHDGVEWTAEVGRRRQGVEIRPARSRGRRPAQQSMSGNTIVAIFAGPPCHLLFEEPREGRTAWANPQYCGEPSKVTLFDT